ncbi:MAG TPA: alpha/beta hydrolase [Candidatus Binatia bacterium]|jgi:pimeloyl-ACP methyl ester carboxylesterase|nr:alpha/beta hydrolase [Candidatus Binatia bacterium]
MIAASLVLVLLAGCAAPVRVQRADPKTVHRELTRSVLTGPEMSIQTHNVLHRYGMLEQWKNDPVGVLTALHTEIAGGNGDPDVVFALAELSFFHAGRTKQPSYYLASAVYAWAFLFPVRREYVPHRFDPRVRLASDLYNLGVTNGLEIDNGKQVAITAGTYPLPFGELVIDFDEAQLRWGDRKLANFAPAAELKVTGLAERYRRTGLGAPLAAGTVPLDPEREPDEFIAKGTRVPVTALLRIPEPRKQIASGTVHAKLDLYDAQATETVQIGERIVPLEVEPTAALAYMLTEQRAWDVEISGFFGGAIPGVEQKARLRAVQPYRRGRIPVVFVHGTASSAARWADMVNDLSNDPLIREHFQFWYFTYDTGNPILFTADALRQLLIDAVARLDPAGTDPALQDMVVIGHSQGGLLTKTTAIDSGQKFYYFKTPFADLKMSDENRAFFQRVLFLKPLPFVKRVVFISTPHRGSYIAGNWLAHQVARFIKLPGRVVNSVGELVKGNPELATFRAPTAVDNMTPTNPFVKALAEMSVAPGIASNSIVSVAGDGPVEGGDDGVVEYSSAHRTDVESEFIVRSPHSCQSNPATIGEVRRILLLHLAEYQERVAPPPPEAVGAAAS